MVSSRFVRQKFIRRAGFSMLELLVIVAIIGILLAISIPVVRDMRSLSRRSNCDQNLIRLTQGMQAYGIDYSHLPSGTLSGSATVWEGESGPSEDSDSSQDTGATRGSVLAIASLAEGYHHNWVSALLPYCDREGMFQALNFDVGVYDPANQVMRESDVPFFRCPASASIQNPNSISYAGMHSSQEGPITMTDDGLLMLNRQIIPDDVPDGMAYTILLGEKLSPPEFDLGWMSGTRSSLRGAGIAINSLLEKEAFHDPAFVGGVGSLHAGGASVAMGDTSVRFLSESIAMDVYRQLVSRKDGAAGENADQE